MVLGPGKILKVRPAQTSKPWKSSGQLVSGPRYEPEYEARILTTWLRRSLWGVVTAILPPVIFQNNSSVPPQPNTHLQSSHPK
jgi:hypothetical protein